MNAALPWRLTVGRQFPWGEESKTQINKEKNMNIVQLVYVVLSIVVVALVIWFGVGPKSQYVPPDKEKDQDKRWKGSESDASTN